MRQGMLVFTAALVLASWTSPSVAGDRRADLAKVLEVYGQRADVAKHKEAAKAFSDLAEAYPGDKEIQLFCARTAYFCAHRLEGDDKAEVAQRGVTCAQRMLEIKKNDYDGRYWWARTSLKARESEGIQAALKQANVVRDFLDKMVKDDPSRFEGYMALGAVLREVPGLFGGDKKKALEMLKKGYEIAPRDAELLLELAAAYAANGDKETAALMYDRCVNESDKPEDLGWETEDARTYAKKMKAKL
ncbi:MAG: hypothetical protein ABIK09_01950 [Pseudomonadota bacterium]